jgi:hypothetical protein
VASRIRSRGRLSYLDGLYGALLCRAAGLELDLIAPALWQYLLSGIGDLYECRSPRSYPLLRGQSRILRTIAQTIHVMFG